MVLLDDLSGIIRVVEADESELLRFLDNSIFSGDVGSHNSNVSYDGISSEELLEVFFSDIFVEVSDIEVGSGKRFLQSGPPVGLLFEFGNIQGVSISEILVVHILDSLDSWLGLNEADESKESGFTALVSHELDASEISERSEEGLEAFFSE